jgi:hypothetical protein
LLEHWTGARLELAQHDNIGRERALFDDRLEIGLKSVPLVLVDEEFEPQLINSWNFLGRYPDSRSLFFDLAYSRVDLILSD